MRLPILSGSLLSGFAMLANHAFATDATSGITGNTLCLNAQKPGGTDTYTRIENVFGKGAVEAPSDTHYAPARPHIIEAGDDVVPAYFAVLAIDPTDVNLDGKTIAEGSDRSRTEIKIAPSLMGMHQAFKARENNSFVYSWRFKIDAGMKFSPSFTHIHQIKAYGGRYAEPPLITFTPLASGRMEVRQIDDLKNDGGVYHVLGTVALSQMQGQWIDVREQITFSNSAGRYQLSMRGQDDKPVLEIDSTGLQLWRTGADHMRPKWGIYRKHHAMLNQDKDDYVYFANLGITRGGQPDSSCR
ncbi:heparin lyase I family protein [Undibacterium sp. TC4M20W]|uniref:heparin lyase I family protein n=1 Tax=Undibacterium sp. TC4M20W TaxID=3413052 RepID=UPI003BF23193